MPSPAESALVERLRRARALHAERAASPKLAAALDHLARWQSLRLRRTYADLAREARYAGAIAFFGTDLYGPGDFSRRDADLARVAPLMGRMLPEGALATVAGAVDLSVLSHELDRALLDGLDPRAPLTVERYCAAYRAADDRAARERQISLIVSVGRGLDRYVRRPLMRSALAAMRRPARLAGFGALQDFLERGFAAFRSMRGAEAFLATVEARETRLMDAILEGDPAPFPEPDPESPKPRPA
ncbi:MAG TPA: hypothetical protein VMN79_16185 [Casimicrobiaceae bacterium]|nr:hypothetical protein [Casimicrobiaceae bacterium]